MEKLALLLSVFLTGNALAANLSEFATQRLAAMNLQVEEVSESTIPGFMQVVTGQGLFYVSNDGKQLLQGNLFNIESDRPVNLTEQKLSQLRVAGINKLESGLVTFPAKDEKYRISVFTDTSCGYCGKLHQEMQGYNDLGITVQYLAFPRGGQRSPAFQDLASVWCAKDQQSAMTAMQAGGSKAEQQPLCQAPIEEHYQFGVRSGVDSTPTIVLENGMLLPGYRNPEDLLALLKRAEIAQLAEKG
ncbi:MULTISPECIES: bifunctional protein-disulfide isomerase/oxidoreductase DsbC [Thalassomonas]|uniref:Thiol:disulfide interchange protein n=1 Tax=Thalassomonas actiniarum TaxID=485447 RepID=A0AAF0C2N2_9GAMM|nr:MULTISPECIES: bifunctional protein-disulfide isomerase/oxidoreductase DsbC [Thalassomonas]WDD98035.1 bifunctional protein-disulfide isomerase/oxidoreductase DsbC [Thalassomonas actiniarum]